MTQLFKKLNLKDHTEIVVLNAPDSFETELEALDGVTIRRDVPGDASVGFAVAFAVKQAEVDAAAAVLTAQAAEDAVIWFAYPKGTSKKYRCEFNRDTGWAALDAAGFRPVRQVAIDADWSALRFRRKEHVKSSRK